MNETIFEIYILFADLCKYPIYSQLESSHFTDYYLCSIVAVVECWLLLLTQVCSKPHICCKGWTIIRNLRQIGNHWLAAGGVTPGGPSFGWRKHFDPYSGRLLAGS